MSDIKPINLTAHDLQRIENEIQLEINALPELPTVEDLQEQGYQENTALNTLLDWIGGLGRVLTLLIAELIQSGAAVIIAFVFAKLEYERVLHGATALGQTPDSAALIAGAVVLANVVHPIYSLRALRGQKHLTIVKPTLRGYLEAFWARLWGKPSIASADLYHNPTLHMAAAVITWSTVVLAVYDILSPLLTQIFTGTATKPLPIMFMEFLMGLGLSVAGVFFLQSAAHEIGVRTISDQPVRLTDMIEQRRAERAEQVAAIREQVRTRYVEGKINEREARQAGKPVPESNEEQRDFLSVKPNYSRLNASGNGRGDHALEHE